jgi:hypothetical protein
MLKILDVSTVEEVRHRTWPGTRSRKEGTGSRPDDRGDGSAGVLDRVPVPFFRGLNPSANHSK